MTDLLSFEPAVTSWLCSRFSLDVLRESSLDEAAKAHLQAAATKKTQWRATVTRSQRPAPQEAQLSIRQLQKEQRGFADL